MRSAASVSAGHIVAIDGKRHCYAGEHGKQSIVPMVSKKIAAWVQRQIVYPAAITRFELYSFIIFTLYGLPLMNTSIVYHPLAKFETFEKRIAFLPFNNSNDF